MNADLDTRRTTALIVEGGATALALKTLVWVCAWCHPGLNGENFTHGICPKHLRALLKENRLLLAAWHDSSSTRDE